MSEHGHTIEVDGVHIGTHSVRAMLARIAELETALAEANAKFVVERKAKERYFYGWKAEASQWGQWETTAVAEGRRSEQAEAELRKWKADFRAMETVALDHERELAALKGRRCETCDSWDAEEAQVVASVAYSLCDDKRARRHHESSGVRPSYWVCPLWTARAEEGSGDE